MKAVKDAFGASGSTSQEEEIVIQVETAFDVKLPECEAVYANKESGWNAIVMGDSPDGIRRELRVVRSDRTAARTPSSTALGELPTLLPKSAIGANEHLLWTGPTSIEEVHTTCTLFVVPEVVYLGDSAYLSVSRLRVD